MVQRVMKLDKVDLFWSGLHGGLLRVLKAWRPPSFNSEREYRDALFDHLRRTLPESAKVEKEYRHRGMTADLHVRCKEGFPISRETEVLFELKLNLKRRNYYNLVGQIQGYDPRRNRVYVVLVGETEPELVARLKDQYKEFLMPGAPWLEPAMALVEVPLGGRQSSLRRRYPS